jgi:hypothetical protein
MGSRFISFGYLCIPVYVECIIWMENPSGIVLLYNFPGFRKYPSVDLSGLFYKVNSTQLGEHIRNLIETILKYRSVLVGPIDRVQAFNIDRYKSFQCRQRAEAAQ